MNVLYVRNHNSTQSYQYIKTEQNITDKTRRQNTTQHNTTQHNTTKEKNNAKRTETTQNKVKQKDILTINSVSYYNISILFHTFNMIVREHNFTDFSCFVFRNISLQYLFYSCFLLNCMYLRLRFNKN